MRHSFTARAAMALLILTGARAPVFAQQAQAPQYACYVPGSGTVYRIKETKTPTQCGTGHTEFQMAGTKPSSGPTGPAGGDLGGTYPNPLVMKLQGQPIVNAGGAFDFSNPNGLLSNGVAGVGFLPISGAGTRFMWYPAKRALRAGTATGTEWDNDNIGDGSIGLGIGVKASGIGATSIGSGTEATGDHAVALGNNSLASGKFAVALGGSSSATGLLSLAFGNAVTASSQNAVAIGAFALASGVGGTAIGSVVSASGNASMALGNYASTNGMQGAFVYGDGTSQFEVKAVAPHSFVVRAQHYWFGTGNTVVATDGRLLETSTGAYLTSGGAWTNSSDVNRKHAFERVDADSVLDKIAAMPVQTWSYKTEADSVRHMGPTAQDFRRAFGLGDTDKAIATVDADGVSLAGIKALVQRTTELRRENQELRGAIADLYRRLSELEAARR